MHPSITSAIAAVLTCESRMFSSVGRGGGSRNLRLRVEIGGFHQYFRAARLRFGDRIGRRVSLA
jgi:hypothetical protein